MNDATITAPTSREIAIAACCVWEGLLSMRPKWPGLDESFNRNGACAIRQFAASVAEPCELDWRAAAAAGYDAPFDWEYVPKWLTANLRTVGGHLELERPRAPVSHYVDPLDKLVPQLRAWLVDEMGMTLHPIHANGNALCHLGGGGWHMLLTMTDGGGLPEPHDWLCCVYPPDDPEEAIWSASSADKPRALSLQQAVAAGCSIMAGDALPPPSPYDRVPDKAWERLRDILIKMGEASEAVVRLYDEFPDLNDVQPADVSSVWPKSMDEYAAELSIAVEAAHRLSMGER